MNLGQSLGNMAGGAVQGFQGQEHLQLAQKSEADNVNLRNRQMVMAEKDQAYQDGERERQTQLRTDSAALFKKYYGEQTETVGETESTAPDGSTMKVPTVVTKTYQPGQDADRDNKWYVDHLAMNARRSGMSMDDMAKVAERVDTGRRTEAGRQLDRVMMGDESATASFLKSIGKDPTGAKLDRRPAEGVNEIILGDGTKFDLKRAAAATATAAYYKELKDEEKSAMDGAKTRAQVGNITSQSNLRDAEASEIPSKIGMNNARAGESGAKAGYYSAKGASVRAGAGAAVDKKLSSDIMTNAKGAAGPDPTGDGKAPYTEKYAFLTGRANELARGGKVSSGLGAVAAARKEWQTTESQVADQLSKVDKKVLKEKYKTSDVATLTARAMKTWAAKNTVATPVGGGGGDASDEADASE